MLCAYFYNPEHVTKDNLDLVKKWEEKKMHCNMVHVNPWKNNNKDNKVDVQVVTRGGENIGRDFKQVENLSQNPEGKIKKVGKSPP